MSKSSKKGKTAVRPNQKAKGKRPQAANPMEMKPWISLRSGLIIMAIVSIGLGINTGWQAVAQGRTVIDGVLFGMFFGGSIWLIFLGAVLLQRLLRKGREKQK